MKNRIKSISLLIAIAASLAIGPQQSYAQGSGNDVIRQKPCTDETISAIADSIKNNILKQGFILVKENSMQMESEYEMPIIVPLNQGTWYHIVYIGDPTSRLYELRMFDWNEKQVIYKKNLWGDVDGPVISYSYIPKFSEYHMIKTVQINKKKKNVCGYVMMFKKVEG